ncbi:Crp/Fnr family transcriptional regulator [Minwuia sp.]|uniref:Crp/Fnr family transcriptional regulator n=1 Tax=Minwuia sp. TaxID=2493630 RepID=UPI003A8F30F1
MSVSQAPLLQMLADESRNALLKSASIINLDKNQFLFHEGDPPESFFIIASGWISLFKQDHMGKRVEIGVFGPRESFAEAARHMQGYPVNAQTMTPAQIACFRWSRIAEDLQRDPDLAKALSESTSRHLEDLVNRSADATLLVAHERLAAFLLQSCPPDCKQTTIRLPFAMGILAKKLGLTPETLSRAFARLADHSVSRSSREIRIDDVDSLKALLPP